MVSGGLGNPPHNLVGAKIIAFNDNAILFTGSPGQDNNEVYYSANGSDWDLITFEAWSTARHNSIMEPIAAFNGRLLVGTGILKLYNYNGMPVMVLSNQHCVFASDHTESVNPIFWYDVCPRRRDLI